MSADKQNSREGSEAANLPESLRPVPERPKETVISQPETTKETPSATIDFKREAEKIKEAEKKAEKSELSQSRKPATPPPSKLMTDQNLVADLRHVMSLDKPKQVKVLVYLAFTKGVHHAFAIASKLKDPYLMDEFHDIMVDELYELLMKRKKIKNF